MWQELVVFGLFALVLGTWVFRTFIRKAGKSKTGPGCDKCGV